MFLTYLNMHSVWLGLIQEFDNNESRGKGNKMTILLGPKTEGNEPPSAVV